MADWLRFLLAVLPGLAVAAAPVVASDTDWPSYANDAASTKYAPLEQIHAGNVHRLAAAWSWASPDNALGMFPGPFKSTPIKVGDTLYVSTSLGHVAAIDAVTGQQRWAFDTGSWRSGKPANLGFNHRGAVKVEEAGPSTQFRYQRTGPTSIQGPGYLPLTKPPHGRFSALDLSSGNYDWVVPNGDGLRQHVIDLGAPDPGPVGQPALT